MKRKNAAQHDSSATRKRACIDKPAATSSPVLKLLQQYYKHVGTLRQFLIGRLGKTSKRRRRNLVKDPGDQAGRHDGPCNANITILDTTFVGWDEHCSIEASLMLTEIVQYRQDRSTRSSAPRALRSLEEILDFSLWRRQKALTERSSTKHILLDQHQTSCGNRAFERLTGPAWMPLLSQVGSNNANILVDLFTECAVFSQSPGNSNVVQISGPALNDLDAQVEIAAQSKSGPAIDTSQLKQQRDLPAGMTARSSIVIERYRVLCALPQLTHAGRVRFGLGGSHVMHLTRDSARDDLVKAIFVSREPTKGPAARRAAITPVDQAAMRLPRRLRGSIAETIAQIQRKHLCTPYNALLDHYCAKSMDGDLSSPMSHSTADSHVSAFARAVVRRVFGKQVFGSLKNWQKVAHNIDHFVRLRRHEHTCLHEILDGMTVSDIDWLAPENAVKGRKLSLTDFEKRKQLLSDFLFFLFDNFLIDLIRTNFYVTDSSLHRNKLLYFRHDVWRALSQPAIAAMRANMLQRCDPQRLEAMRIKGALGISRVRFVPKDSGMRPIVNLRGKPIARTDGTLQKGRSINKILAPAFHALTYEKTARPGVLGSAVFSAEEIFPKLRDFRTRLNTHGQNGAPLYFARLDIKSCFDSLPQDRLLEVAYRVLCHDTYSVSKYASGRLLGTSKAGGAFQARPVWRYKFTGCGTDASFDIDQEAASGGSRAQAILVDLAAQRRHSRSALLKLLEEHISGHLVELGGECITSVRV